MNTRISPFLMFEGRAEEAMRFYVSLFPDAVVTDVKKWGADGPGGPEKEGTIMTAIFSLAGQRMMCSDSPIAHAFTFTPSVSLFVDCETAEELKTRFEALMEGGEALMPLGDYGFSQQFGWVKDRFGVTWQLNLA